MPPFNPIYILINIICAILGILTISCNAVAVWLIFRKERDWDNALRFILNLAVADGIMGVLVICNVTFNINNHQIFFECIFRLSAVNSVIFTSVFVLLGLTFDRYMKIIFPLHYTRLIRDVFVRTYLVTSWIVSLILIFIPALMWIDSDINYNICSYFVVLKPQYLIAFCAVIFCALSLKSVMYGHILVVAIYKTQRRIGVPESHKPDHCRNMPQVSIQRIIKPTRAVLTVIGVNLITMIPVGIYVYIVAAGHLHHEAQGTILIYIAAPLYVNSLINPFLYAFKIPDIKTTLLQYLPCCKSTVHPEVSTVSTQVQHS